MNQDEKKNLKAIVERGHKLQCEIDGLKDEIKALADSAWEKAGVKAKVVRQLIKEKGWDNTQRMERQQFEEALDTCRTALGILASTPLGQAEIDRMEAGAAQHHGTNPRYKSNGNKKARQPAGAY
jgi:uncharacterized protein (UPF0335 family)